MLRCLVGDTISQSDDMIIGTLQIYHVLRTIYLSHMAFMVE